MRKPREPEEMSGLKATSSSGYPSSRAAVSTAAAPEARRQAGPRTPIASSSAYVSALSFERRTVSGPATSTAVSPNRCLSSASGSSSKDDCGRTASTRSSPQISTSASVKSGSLPGGTRWKASQKWRPIASSDMSVPTRRTSRSPFSRSARINAGQPGTPDAVRRIVSGLMSSRFGLRPAERDRARARRRASPASSPASSRPGRPRSPDV